MARWNYIGTTAQGRKVEGSMIAKTKKDVRKKLRTKNIKIKTITTPSFLEFDLSLWFMDNGFAKPFSHVELINFTKQFSMMLHAGISISEIFRLLYKSEKNYIFKRTLKNISREIVEGGTLAEALEKENGFDQIYCNLVKAGESGGLLAIILNKISEQMEKQVKMKKQIKKALTYPTIVTSVGIVIVWGLLTFVVPQFTKMLEESGKELPVITKTVIGISDFLNNYIVVLFGGVFVGGFFLVRFIKTRAGKKMFDNAIMRIPLFGEIIIKGNLEEFIRTLGVMISSGIPLIEALEICIEIIDNSVMQRDFEIVRKKIIQGKTLTEALSRISYFPEIFTSMVAVGEETGDLDGIMKKLSDLFEDEITSLISNATSMIEPLVMVVLGGIIGFVLIAMYLPMFMNSGGT